MFKKYLSITLELSKYRITIMVAITTITGYILAKRQIDTGVILPALGIFLMACSSSVLNQLQEWRSDAFMARTKNRPLPIGMVSRTFALLLILSEIIPGIAILYFSSGTIATILGIIAFVWYNGIYTPLKKITAHAVIPGSVIGAIPPLVGWVAGNGSLASPYAWIIAVFFFVWQVPHFYLLAYKYAPQYKEAGFPVITDFFSDYSIRFLIYVWILLTSIATGILQISGLVNSFVASVFLLISVLWLNAAFIKIIYKNNDVFSPGKYFMKINYFVLIVVIILSIDHLLY